MLDTVYKTLDAVKMTYEWFYEFCMIFTVSIWELINFCSAYAPEIAEIIFWVWIKGLQNNLFPSDDFYYVIQGIDKILPMPRVLSVFKIAKIM